MINNELICAKHNKLGLSLSKKPKKDYRIEVAKQLNYHINDDDAFKGRQMHGQEGFFTRRWLLPFGPLIVSIIRMGKQGLQREMDSFFRETENEGSTSGTMLYYPAN
jgi:hypothetical protein